MMNTYTPTIDVDAENSSRNQRVCIGKKRKEYILLHSCQILTILYLVLSDDEGDDDSTSDEM